MQQTRSEPPLIRKSGTQAVVGALLAIVGVLAAANPGNLVLVAISEAAPHLAHAVPTVITACGAIIAAFSAPPKMGGAAEQSASR
ncbi:MAG: hypothetical protein H0X64_10830 [Gemmatimonadaceae bacterium]|nr:hypothetical protein [Gemmatimonadaceae bacterium]